MQASIPGPCLKIEMARISMPNFLILLQFLIQQLLLHVLFWYEVLRLCLLFVNYFGPIQHNYWTGNVPVLVSYLKHFQYLQQTSKIPRIHNSLSQYVIFTPNNEQPTLEDTHIYLLLRNQFHSPKKEKKRKTVTYVCYYIFTDIRTQTAFQECIQAHSDELSWLCSLMEVHILESALVLKMLCMSD